MHVGLSPHAGPGPRYEPPRQKPDLEDASAHQRAAACRAAPGASAPYQRRRPEETILYQVIPDHLNTFLAQVEQETGTGLPQFVKTEFEAFLECGILAHGFLRLRCGYCAHEKLVAFSCKRRGFFPACGARRMAETAAHLVEQVIPHVPVRKWVVSFPIRYGTCLPLSRSCFPRCCRSSTEPWPPLSSTKPA